MSVKELPLCLIERLETPPKPLLIKDLRARSELPDNRHLHRSVLAYASDYHFLGTSMQPHGVSFMSPGIRVASVDHSMWFHRDFHADQWLLHVVESPVAHGGRALVRGQIFSADGQLVASTAQEGVVRQRK